MQFLMKIITNKNTSKFFTPLYIINHWFLLTMAAGYYDIHNDLAGGPATMIVGLALGPVASIFISWGNWFLIDLLRRKEKFFWSSILLFMHLILICLVIYTFNEGDQIYDEQMRKQM